MNISHEQRLKFLNAHNDLRDILMTLNECHDIWVSDIGKLERLQNLMHSVLNFVPQRDDEGHIQHYADWVLADVTVNPDGEQPYVD
jgi:hypothetical protein